MPPKIIVAGRREDALGRTLASSDERPEFVLEFCQDRDALVERVRAEPPAALVVGLRSHRTAPVIALVRRMKQHCPHVPVLIACLDAATPGRDVLSVARAGADHFAFDQIDSLVNVLRTLVSPDGPDAPGRRAPTVDQLGIARARRSSHRMRYATPAASFTMTILPQSAAPLLRRLILACLGSLPPRDVAALASRVGLARRSLTRETVRRDWPSPRALLHWGRLFRGAVAGLQARVDGVSWSDAQIAIARAAQYDNARTASRAYRARAGVTLRDVWRDGTAALVPALLAATGAAAPPDRLAS